MNSLLMSVDPGKEHIGVALWSDYPEWRLCRAMRLEGPQETLAQALFKWLRHAAPWDLAIEVPQIYARSKSRGDQNDLVDVAVTVGMVAGACSGEVTKYKPREWKGGIRKPTKKAQPYPVRERLLASLSPEELEGVSLPKDWRATMDVWDAIGVGAKHLRLRGLRK